MPMALWVVQVRNLQVEVVKQVAQLSINQSALGKATASSQPAQTTNVLAVQSSDQKGNQQPWQNRKKGKNNNNKKGGNKNENANNNDKNGKNAGGDKQNKRKVKFPCKLCKDDHLNTCALEWIKLWSS